MIAKHIAYVKPFSYLILKYKKTLMFQGIRALIVGISFDDLHFNL